MQSEQAEHPGGGRAELVVGPGQHGTHVGHRVVGLQRVQAAAGVTQFGGQFRQRPLGLPGWRATAMDRARGKRAQDSMISRRRFGLGHHPVLAEPAGQHLQGLVGGQHIQRDQRGALRGHQPGQLVPAGHHDQAARRAGQQGPDLSRVARVVQHDQHLLAVEQAAVQGGPPCSPTAMR